MIFVRSDVRASFALTHIHQLLPLAEVIQQMIQVAPRYQSILFRTLYEAAPNGGQSLYYRAALCSSGTAHEHTVLSSYN